MNGKSKGPGVVRSGRTSSSSSPKPRRSGARDIAHAVLMELELHGGWADECLEKALGLAHPHPRDRVLAHELIYGVLRFQGILDWRINFIAVRPVARVPRFVRAALRLGTYQLLYLDKIPQSAAINESVLLVKRYGPRGGDHWARFVNAVLRALTRDPAPSLPDETGDPIGYLALSFSCPPWLVERWLNRYGMDRARVVGKAMLTRPPLTLRANSLKGERDQLMATFAEAGYTVSPTPISPFGFIVEKPGRVTEFPGFAEGMFYVEDEAAQLIPPLLDPQPGERILDACAAPGGKATHLAALMDNRGTVVATDINPSRLRLVHENAARLGMTIIECHECDWTAPQEQPPVAPFQPLSFDAILVDAPCSGLGILKRHPEGKWQKDPASIAQCQRKQLALLEKVSVLLRPGGRLVYSTCSTELEENEQVIDRFCEANKAFTLETVKPWVPLAGPSLLTPLGDLSTVDHMHTMDGFFAARLRKAGS